MIKKNKKITVIEKMFGKTFIKSKFHLKVYKIHENITDIK